MATETAAYAQFKAMAERFINAQSTLVEQRELSDREIAVGVLRDLFEFIENSEVDRLRKELEGAQKTIGDLGDEVTRLMVENKTVTAQRDEFKRQVEKFEQL